MGFPLQVLWLLGDAPQTERHLRREWANAGLAPAKLFFSGADQQGTRPRDCARCTSAAACGAACAPVSAACWHSQGAWTWRTTCSGYPSQTSSSTRRSTTAARPVRRAAPSSASAVPHTLCFGAQCAKQALLPSYAPASSGRSSAHPQVCEARGSAVRRKGSASVA